MRVFLTAFFLLPLFVIAATNEIKLQGSCESGFTTLQLSPREKGIRDLGTISSVAWIPAKELAKLQPHQFLYVKYSDLISLTQPQWDALSPEQKKAIQKAINKQQNGRSGNGHSPFGVIHAEEDNTIHLHELVNTNNMSPEKITQVVSRYTNGIASTFGYLNTDQLPDDQNIHALHRHPDHNRFLPVNKLSYKQLQSLRFSDLTPEQLDSLSPFQFNALNVHISELTPSEFQSLESEKIQYVNGNYISPEHIDGISMEKLNALNSPIIGNLSSEHFHVMDNPLSIPVKNIMLEDEVFLGKEIRAALSFISKLNNQQLADFFKAIGIAIKSFQWNWQTRAIKDHSVFNEVIARGDFEAENLIPNLRLKDMNENSIRIIKETIKSDSSGSIISQMSGENIIEVFKNAPDGINEVNPAYFELLSSEALNKVVVYFGDNMSPQHIEALVMIFDKLNDLNLMAVIDKNPGKSASISIERLTRSSTEFKQALLKGDKAAELSDDQLIVIFSNIPLDRKDSFNTIFGLTDEQIKALSKNRNILREDLYKEGDIEHSSYYIRDYIYRTVIYAGLAKL